MIETFNNLIGSRLENIAEIQSFSASFTHVFDPDLPEEGKTKLIMDGSLKTNPNGKWQIRKAEDNWKVKLIEEEFFKKMWEI